MEMTLPVAMAAQTLSPRFPPSKRHFPSPVRAKPSIETPFLSRYTHNAHLHTHTHRPHTSSCTLVAQNTPPETEGTTLEQDAPSEVDVIIVGGGLAGLAAAKHLHTEDISFRLLESSDGVGGRVRTDTLDGYVLDRGFQIFISAYPEARRILNYEELNLQNFYAGALVFYKGAFHRVSDPFRHPLDGILSLSNPIGTVLDKLRVGIVRLQAAVKPYNEILTSPEVTIQQRLSNAGFSKNITDTFFRPFFGGIFFDRELRTTSRLFEFVLKCLALGPNTLPMYGIGEIPCQLASTLPTGTIYLNTKVEQVLVKEDGTSSGVKLKSGELLNSKYGVILAVEGPEAARLLKDSVLLHTRKPPRSTVCMYFSTENVPTREPVLYLNGSGEGIVNNMCFISNVCSSYAPPGKGLVSVSLIGTYPKYTEVELEKMVKDELSTWFGIEQVSKWRHLRTYRIPYAQPDQCPPTNLIKETRVRGGIYLCGDHLDSATFDGALVSGKRAAQALLSDSKLKIKR